MSHGVVCKYHYRGKLSLWLTSVTVWLILREGVAKSPCRCGSIAEIYKDAIKLIDAFYDQDMGIISIVLNALAQQDPPARLGRVKKL